MTDTVAIDDARQQRIERKRAARIFTKDDAPPDLLAAEADEQWWPRKSLHEQWWPYIIPALGVTPDGYWYGHCPFHDWPATGDEPTMLINFHKSVLKCLTAKDSGCHEKRALSLTNAWSDLQVRLAKGNG
jgi:hypothetical protein